jgi:CheY-like chemotaxis protein
MDETTRQRCLEPFFSKKHQRGGTVLGLAMVYGTMERHEGRIEVESQLNKGTSIRLVFPLRQPSQEKKQVAPVAEGTRVPLRVLCIDDEPLLREILKEALEMHQHTVETADGGGSGIEAFHRARKEGRPFDVVITDLGMPGVNGRQVAEEVKRASPQTAVLMLTGWGNMLDESNESVANVDALLSKPPRVNEILEALARLKHPTVAPGNGAATSTQECVAA